jgi:tetratricopeptide (TPR) repeat protein
MKRIAIIFVVLLGIIFIEPFIGRERIRLHLEQSRKMTMSNFVFRFLGQIRYTMASYLWLNVEIYFHELGGVSVSSRVGTGNPKKLGELLGLCRLVTSLDPHFIAAYDVGGFELIGGLGKFKQGFRFLKQGAANNPESARVYDNIGSMYFFYARSCPKAIPYLEKAVKYAGMKLSLGQRYHLIQLDDLQILGQCYERVGSKAKALQTWGKVLKIYPGFEPALIQIKKMKSAP